MIEYNFLSCKKVSGMKDERSCVDIYNCIADVIFHAKKMESVYNFAPCKTISQRGVNEKRLISDIVSE